MTKKEILNIILSERALAIIRMKSAHVVGATVAALVKGGMRVLEITSNTPDFLKQIEQARNMHPHTLTGAGTILTVKLARAAIDSGAQFLVTPHTSTEIVTIATNAGIPVIMGAYTPTEIVQASQAGADMIKLFPAGIVGIPYMKAVMASLDNLRIFAVGGINTDNAQSWLEAGAAGVGIGSQLMAKGADGKLDLTQTANNAKQLVAMVKSL